MGRGKSGIHLAEVSVFAGMTGKNRHFRDLSQQVLSGVVAPNFKKVPQGILIAFSKTLLGSNSDKHHGLDY